MAIVVIGGLITSTFLSLLVIPVVYTYVDDGIEWMRAMARKPGFGMPQLLRDSSDWLRTKLKKIRRVPA